jgi:3-hydroxyisobutyrate dehydrogenase
MAAGARAGTLQIFVGGDAADYQRIRPVLEAMGDPEKILHVGGNVAGYTVKLMINLLWFGHLAATAEVLTVGVRAGVDLATLRRCLLASPAASSFLERDVLSVLKISPQPSFGCRRSDYAADAGRARDRDYAPRPLRCRVDRQAA